MVRWWLVPLETLAWLTRPRLEAERDARLAWTLERVRPAVST